MKLLVDAKSGKLLGCHMVGPDSAEIMQGMAVAVKMGCTKEQLDSVVGIHPRRVRGGRGAHELDKETAWWASAPGESGSEW